MNSLQWWIMSKIWVYKPRYDLSDNFDHPTSVDGYQFISRIFEKSGFILTILRSSTVEEKKAEWERKIWEYTIYFFKRRLGWY